MKLIKDKASAWETYRVKDFPLWGIEKIDRGAWYVFYLWGNERIYYYRPEDNYGRGTGKEKALEFLRDKVKDYESRRVVGITA